MGRRDLLKNASSAASQTLFQTIAFFFLYRYLVERLGIEQFGVWAVVLATASATRISEMGLSTSVTKFVAAARATGDERAASEFIQTAALTLAGVVMLALAVLYPLVSYLLAYALPPEALPAGRSILPFALASIWFATVAGVWQSGLDGYLRSDLRASLAIASTLLFVLLAFVVVPTHGLVGLAAAQVTQGVVLLVFGWILVRRVSREAPLLPLVWSRARLKEMIGYGANVQVLAVVMLLFEPTTKVLLSRFGGLSAAGTFELAQQLVTKMRALIVESNRVVVPVMAGMNARGDDPRGLYVRNFSFLLFLLTPLFFALASALPTISVVWLGHYRPEFVAMAVCLIVGWYVNSVSAPAYFAYMGRGDLGWLTVAHVALGVTNAGLGYLGARAFGTPGVLAAMLISLLVGGTVPALAYHREQHIRWRDIVSRADVWLVVVCVAAATVALVGTAMVANGSTPVWRLGLLLCAALTSMGVAAWWHPLGSRMRDVARRYGAGALTKLR